MIRTASLVLLYFSAVAGAQVVTYEGSAFPDEVTLTWERLGTLDADRWNEGGWFHQFCDLGVWPGPRFGENDVYQRGLTEFAGVPAFFVEWRVETEAPSSILDFFGTPTVVSVSGSSSAYYHFTFTDERILVMRGTALPLVYYDIEPGVPHTYYLEVHGADYYAWYVDNRFVDDGIPDAPYPTVDSVVLWGARHDTFENHAQWDYLRYGVVPEPGGGDYDSDGDVDGDDLYFFQECLLGDGVRSGPGCRFADFDFDADTDCDDWQAFKAAFIASGGAPPPLIEPAAFSDVLLNINGDLYDQCAADMNADGTADGADIQLYVDAFLGP